MEKAVAERNPFSPSFGKIPGIFVNRDNLTSTIKDRLITHDDLYQTTLVSGTRGSGKTVLITEVASSLARRPDWIVINLSSDEDILPTLARKLYAGSAGIMGKLFKPFGNFKVDIKGIGAELGRENETLTEVDARINIENMLQALKRKKKSVLVTIDEIINTPRIRRFASVYQILIREDYDIQLLMSGLPHKLSELQNDEGMTFLLRANRIELEPLYLPEVKEEYEGAFASRGRKILPEAAVAAAKLTGGYAFAFQSLGYELWEAGSGTVTEETVNSVIPAYKKMLFRNSYQKIYAELSAKEREFVVAIAGAYEGNRASFSEMKKRADGQANYASVYRNRLIGSGLITPAERGYVRFTLPFFADFIENDIVPYLD